ncbi:MAG TPA: glutamine synthetase, partial [Beijerinckiaceae bacterium]|nr:glutamine synthetase [Beijerinckiaceae bacterium]
MTTEPAIRLTSAEDARRFVEEGGHAHVKFGVADVDGILRGKYISRDKFFSALEKGLGFCDVIVGWDSNDQLY